MNGAKLIAIERERQVQREGYTPEHDAQHVGYDDMTPLVIAAVQYATPPSARKLVRSKQTSETQVQIMEGSGPLPEGFREHPVVWPWSAEDWKPSPNDRVRELVKAGALIAAEIDRLLAQGDG